jgi:hypothetical protein
MRQPGKGWGLPAVLTSAVSAPLPNIAMDERGDALAVWSHSTGEVQASARQAGTRAWSAPRSLSRPGADALTPQVALDANGDGAVTWARYDGASFVVQGIGYDSGGPQLDGLAVPASGVVGKKLTFAVTPRDVWTTVRTIRWSFGDGGAAKGRLTGHTYMRPGRYAAEVTATDAFGHASSARRWIRISAA